MIWALAAAFFATTTASSYVRWANFEYRTFDLAYYVQAVWQLLHGRFAVSIEGVPLLGNHVEPIVFAIAPIFAIFRHPVVFVAVQNAALAVMGPLAFHVARRLGAEPLPATLLAAVTLLMPGTGYVALHEFHPEAFAAPLLLWMLYAHATRSRRAYWAAIVALLACKENMAVLVGAFCAVHIVRDWRTAGSRELRAWYVWPLAVCALWIVLCTRVITPALNGGSIDYGALYSHLRSADHGVFATAIREPQRVLQALTTAATHGNLLWALLLPLLGLPLLRPHILVIAAPILLQHLLSWRSSEWTIYFHYSAPLLPLLWFATAEAILNYRKVNPAVVAGAVIAACIAAQIVVGPVAAIGRTLADWERKQPERERKQNFIAAVDNTASVVAPLPYLSHLATREHVYSLHYILKGLNTLGRSRYVPPAPTDVVLIDYGDSATFDAGAGYYHPAMKTATGDVIPSSDALLNAFLSQAEWKTESRDELTILRRRNTTTAPPAPDTGTSLVEVTQGAALTALRKSGDIASRTRPLGIAASWQLAADRRALPWMILTLTDHATGRRQLLDRGLCAAEARAGKYEDHWLVTRTSAIAAGRYSAEVIFVDNTKRLWAAAHRADDGAGTFAPLVQPIPVGDVTFE